MMTLRGRLVQLKYTVQAMATIAIVVITFQVGGLRINASPSLPIGLYRTTSDSNAKLVEFCPAEPFASLSASRHYRGKGNCPDGAEPLMKPIVAVTGDIVEFSKHGLAVNGKLLSHSAAQTLDTKNRPLSHCPYGRYSVMIGTVWVLSSFNDRSFDSRYFGPVPATAIRHHLRAILTE